MATLYVPKVPPSLNELMRKYKNRFAYRDLRELWEKELWLALPAKERGILIDFSGTHKMEVNVHLELAQLRDQDNLTASLKPLMDGLKACGYIHNDSPQWIDLKPVTQSLTGTRKNGGTRITITPLHPHEPKKAA